MHRNSILQISYIFLPYQCHLLTYSRSLPTTLVLVCSPIHHTLWPGPRKYQLCSRYEGWLCCTSRKELFNLTRFIHFVGTDSGLYYAGIFCTLFRDINLTSDGRSYGIRKLEFSCPNLCIL